MVGSGYCHSRSETPNHCFYKENGLRGKGLKRQTIVFIRKMASGADQAFTGPGVQAFRSGGEELYIRSKDREGGREGGREGKNTWRTDCRAPPTPSRPPTIYDIHKHGLS